MTDFKKRRTQMVDTQVRPSDVTKFPIIDAMLRVPREHYVPASLVEAAYAGENLDLGGGRVLLEPRTLAKMLEALNLDVQDVVLDLGCGYGYGAAILAHLVDAVVAVEADEIMSAEAESLLAEQSVDNVAVVSADLANGAPKHGPYDAILVEGAVEAVGDAITAQLKEGGRIVAIFAEAGVGAVRVGYKINNTVNWRFSFNAGAPVLPGFSKPAEFAL